jgi:hypothetical protein
MQKILVDGGKLDGERLVQILDDFLVAFHGFLLLIDRPAKVPVAWRKPG